MRYLIVLFVLLSGCVEEPTPKQAEAAAEIESITSPKQLESEALSIERAADEAVKLIEADAKAETDQNSAEAK